MTFETASQQWEAGQRRVREAPPERRATLERIVSAIVDELRRRLGGTFTTIELAELYAGGGTDWATAIAVDLAPDSPWAWDAGTVADAAFAIYLREAVDYAGGRVGR